MSSIHWRNRPNMLARPNESVPSEALTADMKVNLGCGDRVVDGWTNVDYALGARLTRVPLVVPSTGGCESST